LHLLNSGELPTSFSGETVHFRCKWTPPWSFPRRALCRDVLSHANPMSPPSSSPTPASSSPSQASSSVAIVHPWPKVSTPSRSSRRFFSVFPFPCTFGGRPHRISISLPFSVLLCSLPSCRLRVRPSPPLPSAGEDLHEFPFIFSLSFAPRPSLGRPHRRRPEQLELLCVSYS
jgi:hypothetical protein